MQEKVSVTDQKLSEVNGRIQHMESDDKGSAMRKEYLALDKLVSTGGLVAVLVALTITGHDIFTML